MPLAWSTRLHGLIAVSALACASTPGHPPVGVSAGGEARSARSEEGPRTSPPPLAGSWTGTLRAPTVTLRLRLGVEEPAGGEPKAFMVSIDQGGAVIPVSRITRDGSRVRLELRQVGAAFDAEIREDAGRPALVGRFTQHGAKMPLTLIRAAAAAPRRPQLPVRPYPYGEEAIAVESASSGIRLAGTVTRPQGEGPFPAVLLLSGSGPQDRDGTLFGHKPLMVLADALTRRGYLVLRLDDRGVGGSTGRAADAITADLASDAQAALAALKQRRDVDARRVALLGHSEGGLVAAMAAAPSEGVAAVVLLATPGVPGADLLRMQARRLLELAGAPEALILARVQHQAELFRAVRGGGPRKVIEDRVRKVLAQAPETQGGPTELDAAVHDLASPWFRYFLDLDPRAALRAMRSPVLALHGEKDAQVPAAENSREVREALRLAGNADATVRVLPELNHLLHTCTTGAVGEYAEIEETMAPVALEAIGEWLDAHLRAPAPSTGQRRESRPP